MYNILGKGPSLFTKESRKRIEESRNAKFVCDTTIRGKSGWIEDEIFAIFYTEKAHPQGSNYFAVYLNHQERKWMVCNGISATEPFSGIAFPNNDVIYSRHVHDFRIHPLYGNFVDGGRDYLRYEPGIGIHQVKLQIIGDKLQVMEE